MSQPPRLTSRWDQFGSVQCFIVYADVAGYTRLTKERQTVHGLAGAEALSREVHGYFDAAWQHTTNRQDHAAMIERDRAGDGILLLFEEVRDAVVYLERLGVLTQQRNVQEGKNPSRFALPDEEHRFRASITYGSVHVAREDFAATGNAINVGSRFSAAAEPGECVIDLATFARLAGYPGLQAAFGSVEDLQAKNNEKYEARRATLASLQTQPAPQRQRTPYTAQISSSNPTCLLFLIDQSKSMRQVMAGTTGKTKAVGVAEAINELLRILCQSCQEGNVTHNRFFVAGLGYGKHLAPALGDSASGREMVPIGELADKPLRMEKRNRSGGGKPTNVPVWLEPTADGQTPMCAALDRARTVLAGFLEKHPDCFPPVVINVTDGMANDGNPRKPAAALCQLSSSDGNVLLFNANVSTHGGKGIMLPDSDVDLPDDYARMLFCMSTRLPEPMRASAQQLGHEVSAGTRGFAFNAELNTLGQLLQIGTAHTRSKR